MNDGSQQPWDPNEASPQPISAQHSSPALPGIYADRSYVFRRRVLTLFGARIDVFDNYPNVILHCHQKAFRLREDIRLYSDQQQSKQLLSINARNIIDFSAAYDVTDPSSGEFIGTLRRKGWSSLARDNWEVLNAQQERIGTIMEDDIGMALMRRLLSNLIPQKFHFSDSAGRTVASAAQHFNPFVYWLNLNIHLPGEIDPRLILAGTMLLVCIEGRQS